MLFKGGRVVLVKSMLAAMPMHTMLALDLRVKMHVEETKICHGFAWKGRKEVKGVPCLVAWEKVCMPKRIGGLGLLNL